MNRARKAALFNALLFPGWGQIYLKNYKKGILIVAGMTIGMVSFVWTLLSQTVAILRAEPLAKGTVGLESILHLAVKALRALSLSYILSLGLLLILLWALSVIDAYLTGEKKDSPTTFADQQSASPPV